MDGLGGLFEGTLGEILENLQVVVMDEVVDELLELRLRGDLEVREDVQTDPLTGSFSGQKFIQIFVATKSNFVSPFSRRPLLPSLIEALPLPGPPILGRLLQIPVVLTPQLLLQHLNEPLAETLLIVVCLVLAVEEGLTALLIESPILFNSEFIGDPIFENLEDLEQLIEVLEDGLGETHRVEECLAAEHHHIANEFLSGVRCTSSAESTSAFYRRYVFYFP